MMGACVGHGDKYWNYQARLSQLCPHRTDVQLGKLEVGQEVSR